MQKFNTFEQLLTLIEQIKHLPADDDRIIYDPLIENTLEIGFNPDGRKTTDADGTERDVYNRLLLRNVKSFDVQTPDDGRPHRIEAIDQIDDNTYRFVLTHARWIIKLNGEPTGEYGEVVDDVDAEFEFSMGSLIGGLIVIAIIVGLLWWLF